MRTYLAQHGESAPKQLSQLKRVYASHVSQTAMGLAFSRKQAYGHEKQSFRYEKREGKRLGAFVAIHTIEQLRSTVNRLVQQNLTFRIYGIPAEGSPKRKDGQIIDFSTPVWKSMGPRNRAFVENAMYNNNTLRDFVNELADPGRSFIDVFE